MTLKRREKILAYAAGGTLFFVAAYFLLLAGDPRSTAKLIEDRASFQTERTRKQKALADAEREEARLAGWRRRALPADADIARSLYQNWIRQQANGCNFRDFEITSRELQSKKDVYALVEVTLKGRAAIDDFITFLYRFYTAGHLHQIREMKIKAAANPRELELELIKFEAMSLAGIKRNELANEKGVALKLSKVDDYTTPIAKRNIFAPPTPPQAPAKTVDPAEFMFVTGFTEFDGLRQVWIQDRQASKTWKLGEGEKFQLGPKEAVVKTITPAGEVVVEYDKRSRRLRVGENLRGGVEVKD